MGRYASKTHVPQDRSKAEIERTLTRYGADQFLYGFDGDVAVIGFRMRGDSGSSRMVRFTVPLPALQSKSGRGRATAEQKHAQAVRQRWRAASLVIKAKLEAVEAGITTFDQEWLAYMVLPGGKTVGQMAIPEVDVAYDTGKAPSLMLTMCDDS